jgi:competence protein ComFA
MKGYLYAVGSEGGWSAKVTISPEVDLAYWLDAAFRRTVEETACGYGVEGDRRRRDGAVTRHGGGEAARGAGGAEAGRGGLANVVLMLDEPLPLGIAFTAAELFGRKARRVRGEARAARLLSTCARGAEMRGGLPGLAGLFRIFGREQPAGRVRRYASVRFGQASGMREEARKLAAAACEAAAALEGRALLRGEAHALLGAPARRSAAFADAALQVAALLGRLRLGCAIVRGRRRRCRRCGSGEAQMRRTPCLACGRVCAYCEACLLLGRSRECTLLVSGIPAGGASVRARPADGLPPVPARLARWGLSPAQFAAAEAALRWLERPDGGEYPAFLIWAVTGAGKTEMMFPLIESVLARGGNVMIATPRRDVVLELEPRVRRAFPGRSVAALHGASREKWTKADITLATTHQTIRFEAGFDLVVIDELDAFPYHNNPMLQYAAEKSLAPGGRRILLTATPPAELRRAATRGCLPHARVPVRHHGHPLPVPEELRIPSVRELIRRNAVPDRLKHAVLASLSRGAQLFVFVPRISDTGPVAALLGGICPPGTAIGHTSSQDAQRTETVLRFRNRELRVLVTTTILERGVTIPRSDVFVLDADSPLFDEASLEQMAGRAGRSKDDPHGRVYFCSPHATRAQRAAIRRIREMNAIAAARGYIRMETPPGGIRTGGIRR